MSFEHMQRLSGADIPDTGGFIATPRNQPGPILGEGKTINHITMSLEQGYDLAGLEVNEANPSIIWVPCFSTHRQ